MFLPTLRMPEVESPDHEFVVTFKKDAKMSTTGRIEPNDDNAKVKVMAKSEEGALQIAERRYRFEGSKFKILREE